MQVPLLDLKSQYEDYRDEVPAAVMAVLESQMVCNGPAVQQLEAEIASYCDCTAAVGVASGTDALLAALMTLGIGAGDEVVVPTFTFFATAGVVWRVGAKPVFVDIEPDTFNIDASKISAAVTDNTKAIIPVHLYGQMADMDAVMAVADQHGLAVIEDCAQSIGASQNGRKACSIGTCGALSFYPTKNLGAPGDGGMICTTDPGLAEKLTVTRNHGQGGTYLHQWVGGNFRMDTIIAAVLSIKLKHLDGWSAGRRANAARYDQLLADVEEVTTPVIRRGNESIYNQYVIRAERRDDLRAHLTENDVSSGVYYPLSLHQQPCFEALGYAEGDLPVAEQACREVLALPVCAELSQEQITYAAEQIKAFYA